MSWPSATAEITQELLADPAKADTYRMRSVKRRLHAQLPAPVVYHGVPCYRNADITDWLSANGLMADYRSWALAQTGLLTDEGETMTYAWDFEAYLQGRAPLD